MDDSPNKIILFQDKSIRRAWYDEEWYYSIVDVIEVLVDTPEPNSYWNKIQKRDTELRPIWTKLKLRSKDGKLRFTDCANLESILRIIQSIPSPKAEPFKLWLAQVGKERIDEIENPELAVQRIREGYLKKGYSEEWIEKRIRSIMVRQELTDEWRERDVKEGREFGILTSEISKATFELTPGEHSKLKGLKRQNLRDHMTDLELIFTMLGEAATTEITRETDSHGFDECKTSAKKGGRIAGEAREKLELETGKKVVSSENFLDNPERNARRLGKSQE
jgi:DNA-damage-inducible protein D